jgi:uncharacterized membrane protein YhaH (DUF805 family)
MAEKHGEKVGPVGSLRNFFKYYATFSGRSTRSEYWYILLAGAIFYLLLFAAAALDSRYLFVMLGAYFAYSLILGVAVVVPTLALMSRRLRDGGISPYFLFFVFLPLLGWLGLFVMMMFPSKTTTA